MGGWQHSCRFADAGLEQDHLLEHFVRDIVPMLGLDLLLFDPQFVLGVRKDESFMYHIKLTLRGFKLTVSFKPRTPSRHVGNAYTQIKLYHKAWDQAGRDHGGQHGVRRGLGRPHCILDHSSSHPIRIDGNILVCTGRVG